MVAGAAEAVAEGNDVAVAVAVAIAEAAAAAATTPTMSTGVGGLRDCRSESVPGGEKVREFAKGGMCWQPTWDESNGPRRVGGVG